jgi:hypothetical protein
MTIPKKYLFLLAFYFSFTSSKAQIYHDIGFVVGNTYFRSDYGNRGNLENFYANQGYTLGLLYYLGVETGKDYSWKNYFKLRAEVMYMQSKLQHHAESVAPSDTSNFATQLRAMRGETSVGNIGLQLEFYPLMADDYQRGVRFTPYGSIGFQLNGYSSKAFSTLGALGNAVTTPTKYLNAFKNESGFATSFSASVGTRYRLANKHALLADVRLLRYNTDWVDGLNPNRKIYTENKANDYQLTIAFGYVYLFDR